MPVKDYDLAGVDPAPGGQPVPSGGPLHAVEAFRAMTELLFAG